MSDVPLHVVEQLRQMSGNRCEYCHLPQSLSEFALLIDHVIARQHRGSSEITNLSLCCGRCNLSKGPNIAGIDPHTGGLTRLFHPRRDSWHDHFAWREALLVGQTDVGRTTIEVLAINAPPRILMRTRLLQLNDLQHFT